MRPTTSSVSVWKPGSPSQWLYSALAEAGLPVIVEAARFQPRQDQHICVETRHMRAVLKAQINKMDRDDARGMAQMMPVGVYRPLHVKTLRRQNLRLPDASEIAAVEGTLIKGLIENLPDLAVLVEPLLVVRRAIPEHLGILHRRLLAVVRDDDACRRLTTVPAVGPVVALTYRATVDVAARFRKSKSVGAVFGLNTAKN